MNNNPDLFGDIDFIPPKEPVSLSIELSPEEVELAFASHGTSLRAKVLLALVIAMINDPIAA